MKYTVILQFLLISCTSTKLRPYEREALSCASQEAGEAAKFAKIATPQTYPNIVRAALRGDQDALHAVFMVTPHADAAGAEFQSSILRSLLFTLGDEDFSKALSRESKSVIRANVGLVRWSLDEGLHNDFQKFWDLAS